MSDLVLSYIRTYVPLGVGALLSYLAVRYGIGLPEDASAQLAIGATALVTAAYYGVVRLLEKRWPWFGTLLGAAKKPVYEPR